MKEKRDTVSTDHSRTRGMEETDPRVVTARYGSQRAAIGQTLFACLNLGLLLAFGWPAMVIVFDGPVTGVEHLPLDWYAVRLTIAVLGAVLTVVLWKLSPVPLRVATPAAVAGIFQRGVLWTQTTLILLGVSLVLAVLLLLANAGQATKLLLFGLFEVLAVQALFSGYVKSAFDILLDRWRSFLIVTGLFATFFGLQSMALALSSVDTDQNYVLALLAGAVLGTGIGAVSLFLRDRSGSILPAFLFHLIVLHLLIPFFD